MTQQGISAVRALRIALLVVAALIAAISLVAMHSVVASASANANATFVSSAIAGQPSSTAPTATHTDVVSHNSETPNIDVCPCPGSSSSSAGMAECAPLASLAGVTVVAQLRAECAALLPPLPRTALRALVVAQPTAPSLHVLSISRT
ncbi:hypothetical protein GCM10009655_18390 [Rhodoglobus aureus]|uniref:Uncharacterized protein n=2 Tax=Rhodoglobus aureus TaxID=191497 RepID=A0ABP4GFU7_9MICO